MAVLQGLVWPFWNEHERRLRAGWRILLQFTLWVVFAMIMPAVLSQAVGEPFATLIDGLPPSVAMLTDRFALSALTVAAVLTSTWLVVRYIDHRPLSDLGLNLNADWWWDLGFGLALGAGLMALIFGVEAAAGWVKVRATFVSSVEGIPFLPAIFLPVLAYIVVGITEEVLARGYQLRNLAEGLNFPVVGARGAVLLAWLISSFLFGILHIYNPASTWVSTTNLVLAGLFLGLGMVLTGRLGLPIGIHITWNFFQGNVFGFPVSGNVFQAATFLTLDRAGPALWTGGEFGPEAGLVGLAAISLGALLTLVWVRLRYHHIRLYTPLAVYLLPWRPFDDANAHTGGAGSNPVTVTESTYVE